MSRPFFEEGVAERKADPFADIEIGPIGAVRQREGIERRAREPFDVEVTELVRGDLLSQVVGVLLGHRRIERRPVHEFERPRSDPDRHVGAAGPDARCSSIARSPTWVNGHQMSAKTSMVGIGFVLICRLSNR